MKKCLSKLRGRRGETIAETLVALLISAVALVLLAGMVTSSSRLITTSKEALSGYYAVNNDLAAHSGSGGASGALTVTIQTSGTGNASLNDQSYTVSGWKNSTFKTPVYTYAYTPASGSSTSGGTSGG